MPSVAPDDLERITTALLVASGVPEDEAGIVAGNLVSSNLAGHDSHGVMRLPQYLVAIENGSINPGARVECVRETPTTAVLDANWGFGQVAAHHATEIAIEKAREYHLAAVAVRRSKHVGGLGSYVEAIAADGMIGLMFVNGHGGGSYMPPWGGAEARLCTNPLAAGFPTGDEPIVLDISTTAVAEGKVRTYRIRGEEVPDLWLVDSEGRPTNDPNVLYEKPSGAILPLGGNVGYKGFGLGMMVDLLAGGLSGAGTSGSGKGGGNAFTIMAFDPGVFVGEDAFREDADALVSWVKSSRLAPDFDEILVPGEIERREAARRSAAIPVDAETWGQIVEAAERLHIPTDDLGS